jgi:hypothetical protein
MVIVARNFWGIGVDTPEGVWNAIRPAAVAADPAYQGEDTRFCKDYSAATTRPISSPGPDNSD